MCIANKREFLKICVLGHRFHSVGICSRNQCKNAWHVGIWSFLFPTPPAATRWQQHLKVQHRYAIRDGHQTKGRKNEEKVLGNKNGPEKNLSLWKGGEKRDIDLCGVLFSCILEKNKTNKSRIPPFKTVKPHQNTHFFLNVLLHNFISFLESTEGQKWITCLFLCLGCWCVSQHGYMHIMSCFYSLEVLLLVTEVLSGNTQD